MALNFYVLSVFFFNYFVFSFSQLTEPEVIYEWSNIDYKYPSNEERQKDIDSKNFIPDSTAILDVDVAFPNDENKKTYFVTTPRFQPGPPATLGKITKEKIGQNYLIDPYPNWNWHKNPEECNKDRLISVYRIQIDSCGRLWVLDNGNYQGELICQPQILAFDLNNDELIYRHEIPTKLLESTTLLVTPIVDTSNGCTNTFVYSADCKSTSLFVTNIRENLTWKIQDKTMYPDPSFGTYTILGESFELMDGILGMSLLKNTKTPKLFYHAMSSNTEHSVLTEDIQNSSKFLNDPMSSPEIFSTLNGRRKSQSPAEVIDKNGILYFGDVNEVTLNCWDTSSNEYGGDKIKILSKNTTILQFISGIKVIDCLDTGNQELYFLTSRFQKVSNGNINVNEINFRILKMDINDVTQKKCCGK